jgi:hypothetical protein
MYCRLEAALANPLPAATSPQIDHRRTGKGHHEFHFTATLDRASAGHIPLDRLDPLNLKGSRRTVSIAHAQTHQGRSPSELEPSG